MAALSYPQETEEGKERSSLADEAGLFFFGGPYEMARDA